MKPEIPKRPWEPKDEETALMWALVGVKPFVIARRLNRSVSSVTSKIEKMKRKRNLQEKPPPDRKRGELSNSVRILSGPGISDQDMAKILDVNTCVVTRTRHRLGIPPGCERYKSRKAWKPGDPGGIKAAIVRLYGKWGMSDADMARITGHAKQLVRHYRVKLGLPVVGFSGRRKKEIENA
jgi:hypothetical protein